MKKIFYVFCRVRSLTILELVRKLAFNFTLTSAKHSLNFRRLPLVAYSREESKPEEASRGRRLKFRLC